ncbi:hypothetical protein NEOLEDRAFT_976969 [Neolentinus lepideus HHB14362 ss-1]|uniref:Uncharacterized protein n=1 Tax=Neolentinus lepideus HHB14362 ss-1 TaxID=1314782 RepID=A0A165N8J3_9AGAM|nr:hypothetical protein NEOLEDRAFT_976969 [Neolentinus lepideus HHB14362 ss-1]
MDDICMYLHSSGSTGFPKAIPQMNKAILDWCSFRGDTNGDHSPPSPCHRGFHDAPFIPCNGYPYPAIRSARYGCTSGALSSKSTCTSSHA